MKNYELQAIVKFMLIYFVSVFVFILLAGHFYYKQERSMMLIKLAIKMHEYQQNIKRSNLAYKQEYFNYKILQNRLKYKDIELPIVKGSNYIKLFPYRKGRFILIFRDSKAVDDELRDIKKEIVFYMIAISIFFLILSYFLAKMSLKPMREIIQHLDNFTKELIHDINTPISSILLNIRGLKKKCPQESVKIKRIEDSTKSIVSLYENLAIILSENQLELKEVNLIELIDRKVELYQELYPDIEFFTNIDIKNIKTNQKAFERIIDNILINSCKYSKDENSKISIYTKKTALIIEDNGKGIKQPQKVFEKNYTESSGGHGIGMYIVHRLANSLDIKITITSHEGDGTKVELLLIIQREDN